MNITIKKYMIIDLAMLISLGVIVELIAMFAVPRVLNNASPFFVVSLLICILAVERWNFKGAISIPIMAVLSTLIGFVLSKIAKIEAIKDLEDFYNWRVVLTNVISFGSSLLLIPLKKTFAKKEMFGERITAELIALVILVVCYVAQVLVFSMVAFASPVKFAGTMAINMLPAVLVTLLFMAVLRHQGILVDAKKDLIDKQKEKELEEKYYSAYRSKIINRSEDDDSSKK